MKENIVSKEKLENYLVISGALLNYQKEAENISVFDKSIGELSSYTEKLVKLQVLADMDNSDVDGVKDKCRAVLVEKLSKVVTLLKIYAYDQKKQKLEKLLKPITLECLQECSDIALMNYSQKIWQVANNYGGYSMAFTDKLKVKNVVKGVKASNKLEKQYGLTAEMVKEVEEFNLQFIQVFYSCEKELSEQKAIIKKIKRTSVRAERLMKFKLDGFVSLFGKKSPEFNQAYVNARLANKKINSDSVDEDIESDNSIENEGLKVKSKKNQKSKDLESPIS